MPIVRLLACAALVAAAPLQAQSTASSVVDTAIARMGGRAALDGLHTAQYELVTQWIGLAPEAQPLRESVSYERHSEWRDYDRRIWRNVRRSLGPSLAWTDYTDVVLDTVAARRVFAGWPNAPTVGTPAAPIDGWVPLSIAYVDERRELFAWAPERVVRGLRDAKDLTSRADTVVGGERHAVVRGTIDGLPFTAFFRRATGLPTFVRFHADESNDFGLAPFGPMDVEVWYSRWAAVPNAGVTLPRQWDTRRLGRLYKRMSVLGVTFNATLPADSLTIPDTVRTLYATKARRPMGDVPIDSAVAVAGDAVVAFFGFGGPFGAVRLGDGWLLLDGGNLPVNAERAAAWLADRAPGGGGRAIGAIVTSNRPGSIAVWAARGARPTYASAVGALATRQAIVGAGASPAGLRIASTGRWLRGTGARRDSVWIEPIELANGSGLLVYVPSQRWAYSGAVSGQLDADLVAAALRRRGWTVERVGVPGRLGGVVVR